MLQRPSGRILLLILFTLALAGCFRQASPDLDRPVDTVSPTVLPTLLPATDAIATPFVTPFSTEAGLDLDSMPTLAGPSPTVPLVEAGSDSEGLVATPTSEGASALPATIPFAAGATFTPVPGAPPVNLNPNLPTPTSIIQNVPTQQGGASTTTAGENCIYFVQAGDTAFYIATLHGITLTELIEYNGMDNADYLFEGQELEIPNCGEGAQQDDTQPTTGPTSVINPPQVTPTQAPMVNEEGYPIHIVQAGENLFRISRSYGVTVDQIVQANGLSSSEAIINVGQQLIIPIGE
jgi:LysM repeat protein